MSFRTRQDDKKEGVLKKFVKLFGSPYGVQNKLYEKGYIDPAKRRGRIKMNDSEK